MSPRINAPHSAELSGDLLKSYQGERLPTVSACGIVRISCNDSKCFHALWKGVCWTTYNQQTRFPCSGQQLVHNAFNYSNEFRAFWQGSCVNTSSHTVAVFLFRPFICSKIVQLFKTSSCALKRLIAETLQTNARSLIKSAICSKGFNYSNEIRAFIFSSCSETGHSPPTTNHLHANSPGCVLYNEISTIQTDFMFSG